jgi:mono/diheme cytochrome c family protein
MRHLITLLCVLLAPVVSAEEINERRAQFNYQLFCQGCHTPDGTGANAVPRMKDQVGYFLATPAGREYLVRVPGSATSALSDARLAEVLNWIVIEFAGASTPAEVKPYSAEEVGRLRQHPLNEVEQYRSQLLADIAGAITGE